MSPDEGPGDLIFDFDLILPAFRNPDRSGPGDGSPHKKIFDLIHGMSVLCF